MATSPKTVYRDGTKLCYIPGTNPPEPFVLMRYKEASGLGYSKITFFLEVRNVIADLREVIESDSHSDDIDDDDDNSFTATASRPTFGENELVEISQKSEKEPCEVTMMVNCPTCGGKYPFSEIEEHADLCADYFVEQPDPLPVDKALIDASDNEIKGILMDDKVLDILETVGYNGVPSRENKDSVKKIIDLNGRKTASCIQPQHAVGSRLSFSPDMSTSLRRNLECRTHMACSQFLTDLENSGLLHCYGKAGRQQENILSDYKKNNIETLVTHRPPCKSAYAQNRTVNENNIINITLLPDTHAADINNNRIGELFTLCVLNAQSLNNKAAQFIDYVVDCKADIVSLTETWFTNTESATRVLCTPNGYNLLDHPRSNRVGGGTGILFKENITVKKLAAGELRSFEYSEWSVVNGSRRLHLIIVYRPPYSDAHPVTTSVFFSEFTNFLESITFVQRPSPNNG
ncbi:Hypothetical predicted protein [Paramuricea clavata]|uniref:Endonuclease/exonuclease/phosphatase domain-containing protein n=1 Tax=Paramuricea clavata TaxID=317549 RepID=A0A6S7G9S4_PARCT|nr:Hypothetical predicted protein [Paramuricea clavata]